VWQVATVDSATIADLIHGAAGFVNLLGPTVVRSSREEAVLRLDAGPELHNHIGGPHAAALFGLGETTCLVVLLEVFGDLVEQGAVPLVKSGEISYPAVTTGPVLATGRLLDDEVAARVSPAERGVAVFTVEVGFTREDDGQETARMTARMALKRYSQPDASPPTT
jgi:acyl-coenzyme A thioesterase PaaI-like protein